MEEIDLYSCWKCVTGITGNGVVIKITEIPEHRYSMYSLDESFDGKLYHFLTDFGNIVIYTKQEVLSNYCYLYQCEDITDRLDTQLGLLKHAREKYGI